jgi:YbgC/YbaW family acyl-CoA thioester hydrolase
MDAPLHRLACEVAFSDTDASGWMHFPNIFHYAERAEHAFLKACGIIVFERSLGGWPRVNVTCDFLLPLLAGDQIEIQLAISRLGASSITWNFEVLNASGQCAAHGSMTTVRVDHTGGPQRIPTTERTALERVMSIC